MKNRVPCYLVPFVKAKTSRARWRQSNLKESRCRARCAAKC